MFDSDSIDPYLPCGIVPESRLWTKFKLRVRLCVPSFRSTVSKFCKAMLEQRGMIFSNVQQASRNPGYSAVALTTAFASGLSGTNIATLKQRARIRIQPTPVLANESSSNADISLLLLPIHLPPLNIVVPSTDICVRPMLELSFGLKSLKIWKNRVLYKVSKAARYTY